MDFGISQIFWTSQTIQIAQILDFPDLSEFIYFSTGGNFFMWFPPTIQSFVAAALVLAMKTDDLSLDI